MDHFERIISQKNSNQNINSSQTGNLTKEKDQGSGLSDSNKVNKEQLTENKK